MLFDRVKRQGAPGSPRRSAPFRLLAVLFLFMLCASTYSIAAPLWEASDESEHFAYVVYLVEHHGLPSTLPSIQPSGNNEANQPPLYYLLAAPLALGLDLGDTARIRLNPHMGWSGAADGIEATAHLLDEGWPYHGAFLAAHRIRLLSTLFGAVTLALTFALVVRSSSNRRLALLTVVLMATLPGFLFASATINNDVLTDTLAAALLLVVLGGEQDVSFGRAAAFGTLALLALLTKLDTAPLVVVGGLALLHSATPSERLRRAVAMGMPLLPAASFWIWRWTTGNRNLVGDKVTWPPPLLAHQSALSWGLLGRFLRELGSTFIGTFGRENILLPWWLYAAYGTIFIVGLLAAAGGSPGKADGVPTRSAQRVLWWWAGVALAAIVVRYPFISGPRTGYASARFLYPALPAIGLLAATGWYRLASVAPRLRGLAIPAAAIGTTVAFALPWQVIAPAYPPPLPVTNAVPRTATAVAHGAFVRSVDLAGVQLPTGSLAAGQAFAVTFFWRVQQPLPDGDWLFVHVADARGQTAAAFDGVPLWNVLPLPYWRPGDVIVDREVLTVHRDAPPGAYALSVGWYNPKTGARVAAVGGGSEVLVGTVQVVAPPPDTAGGAVRGLTNATPHFRPPWSSRPAAG